MKAVEKQGQIHGEMGLVRVSGKFEFSEFELPEPSSKN